MQCNQTTTATLTSNKNNNKSSSKISGRLRERACNILLSAVRLSCVLSRLRFVSAAYSLDFGLALLRALLTSFGLCCMHSRLRLSHELHCRHAAKAALGSSSSDLSLSCVCARNFGCDCGSPTNTKAHESSAALTADRQRRLSSSSLCCCHSVAFVCFTVAHTQHKSRLKALFLLCLAARSSASVATSRSHLRIRNENRRLLRAHWFFGERRKAVVKLKQKRCQRQRKQLKTKTAE